MHGIENVRDFIWADQACNEILKMTQAHNPPGIINLCSGKGRKVTSLVKEVFDLNKIETKTIFNNSISNTLPLLASGALLAQKFFPYLQRAFESWTSIVNYKDSFCFKWDFTF